MKFVLYTAHWDHLGVKPDLPGPDKIYNGAIDNGIGVSSVLEIAEAFVQSDTPPARSVAFLCWTLEEQGLLGSEYFAKNPLWPLKTIVAGINQDGGLPQGGARDMVIVGSGASDLEDMLAQVLRLQNRVISPDPEPEKGGFYRSDHISLAKVGVPMLYPARRLRSARGRHRRGPRREDPLSRNALSPADGRVRPELECVGSAR